MFSKILIANRGEIAIRVIRACRELGVASVAVYSEADADCLHVRYADEAVCIGPAPAAQSYLVMPALIQAALQSGAEAIHPGYGFLAERAEFSRLCREQDIKFIGPSPESIEMMGDKAQARATMTAAGVPVTPGSEGIIESAAEAEVVARDIGLPVMVKASAGGGGKGIRIVKEASELAGAVRQAQAEAEAAFGNGAVYVEKYIGAPRHIEIQVLADGKGHGIHLGERDCSIQRRHQKLIEEAPSPAVSPELRAQMGEAAVAAAVAAHYEGAGTVEFLLDSDGSFYFMEMNTRVQVEHCVTEMVSGVDIVKTGIRIAAGEGLPLAQDDIRSRATPSSSASTPRTRRRTSCRHPAWSRSGSRRAVRGCVSTATSTRATWCRRSTTACSASSSSGGATARSASRALAGRSTSSSWTASRP